MKKWILLLATIILSPALSMAQEMKNPFLYEGDLSLQQVINRIRANKRLPLAISTVHSFHDRTSKDQAIAEVKKQLKANVNFWSYYNAAVVYSAGDYSRGWDEAAYLNDRDAANAVLNATQAIDLYKNHPVHAVYMYLLRGDVYYTQSILWDEREGRATLVSAKREGQARAALADFLQVEKLNPQLAPYHQIYSIAQALNKKELAKQYEQKVWQQQRRAELQYQREIQQKQQKIKNQLKKSIRKENQPFWKKWFN